MRINARKLMFLITAAIAAAMALLAIDAYRKDADAASFTGCGVAVTGAIHDAVLEDIFGANGYGVQGGVLCDRQFDRLVLGVFANYGIGRFDWAGNDIDTQGWQAGGRLGVTLTDAALLYVLAAYEEINAELGNFDVDLTGPVLGGGMEVAFAKGWAGRLEYQRAMLDIDGMNAEVNVDSIHAGLVYRFNWSPDDPFVTKPLK